MALCLNEYAGIGEQAYYEMLPNGLRLTVVPKRGFHHTEAFLAIGSGGADVRFRVGDGAWTAVPEGTAHFLEHELFELSDGRDALAVFAERGADVNAFTAQDMTAIYFRCADLFEENLALLLQMVCSPGFTEAGIVRERGIILRERQMSEDDPYEGLSRSLLSCLYMDHAITRDPAGTVESVGDITQDTLRIFHDAHYIPANMALTVAGDQDPERVRDLVEELTPQFSRRLRRDYGRERGQQPGNYRSLERIEVPLPIFAAGVKTGRELRGKEGLRFELTAEVALSALLGDSSPLFHRLYSAGLVNDTFDYGFDSAAGVSYISFGGESRYPERVVLAVLEEAQRLGCQGVDEKSFLRIVKSTRGRLLGELNSLEAICYNNSAARLKGCDFFESFSMLGDITAEDARSFIAGFMRPEFMALSVAGET